MKTKKGSNSTKTRLQSIKQIEPQQNPQTMKTNKRFKQHKNSTPKHKTNRTTTEPSNYEN